jgi:hypothetical protein
VQAAKNSKPILIKSHSSFLSLYFVNQLLYDLWKLLKDWKANFFILV